ncbi:polymeric immunoglobulin receptor-like isoform X2 [Toxotes jaculatrix]|uniref:polymeric immunoglobulin receptor-like isoform X2 n=1 Tax=Toxotes jaculatrix TaxID=941984 RepID=UPI001B3AE16E|nr:polymeric immunoglobulin receptor-like isoform X2 [Toxotes jaculatrix]
MKMWSLQNLLFILCIALSCVTGEAAVIHVSGYEGGDVHVSCRYDSGYEDYEKYLCRNDCGNSDVLIMTTAAKKDKYSIYDDKSKRVLTTTISDLSSRDAGKYWCGVTRTGTDYYPAEVKLDVVPDSCCDRSTKIQSYEKGSVSISCPYENSYQSNLKYICRGNRPSTCQQQAVTTSDSKQNGRFTLTDNKASRKFTVTITRLTQKDSGSYLCGVHRDTGLDVFSAAELEVKGWCCVKSNRLNGTVGHPLTMQCPYPPQHGTNRKFLCKGDHRHNCTDVVTSQNNSGQTDLRFTLIDDISSSSFSVTITELKAGDAGTYWCGSDSEWSAGNYTKIQLSVVETIRPQSTYTPDKTVKDASLFHSVVYIVPAVLLLILIFALVMVYKYKCHKVQGTEVNMNQKIIKDADREEVMDDADIYENQDVVVYSQQRTSKHQSTCHQYDDKRQQDSVYQNVTAKKKERTLH